MDAAMTKMRANIVPDLSICVIAEHVDNIKRRLKQWEAELERVRADRDRLAAACQRVSCAPYGLALGDLEVVRDAIRKSGLEPLMSPSEHPDTH
jgi:hypothetical protein